MNSKNIKIIIYVADSAPIIVIFINGSPQYKLPGVMALLAICHVLKHTLIGNKGNFTSYCKLY